MEFYAVYWAGAPNHADAAFSIGSPQFYPLSRRGIRVLLTRLVNLIVTIDLTHICQMARLRHQSLSRHRVPLTKEEFASLKEIGNRPMQRTIPDNHRDRLIATGFVREVTGRCGDVSTLALTGAGIRRLEFGEYK